MERGRHRDCFHAVRRYECEEVHADRSGQGPEVVAISAGERGGRRWRSRAAERSGEIRDLPSGGPPGERRRPYERLGADAGGEDLLNREGTLRLAVHGDVPDRWDGRGRGRYAALVDGDGLSIDEDNS